MNKLKYYAKEITLISLFIFLFANIISLYKSSDLNKQKLCNINIELLDATFNKVDKTKPILVHFWATWCPTCKLEASNIQDISKDYQVMTIAVKSGSNNDIQNYLDEHDFTYKVHNDTNGILSSKFKVKAFPTTFIYNKDQELVFSEVGYTSTWGLKLRMWWSDL